MTTDEIWVRILIYNDCGTEKFLNVFFPVFKWRNLSRYLPCSVETKLRSFRTNCTLYTNVVPYGVALYLFLFRVLNKLPVFYYFFVFNIIIQHRINIILEPCPMITLIQFLKNSLMLNNLIYILQFERIERIDRFSWVFFYCVHALSIVFRPSLSAFHISDFFSDTAERNSTKLDRKKDRNVLYQVCVLGPVGKPRWPPWSDTFSTSSLKLLNRIQRNLTGRKISCNDLIGWGIFDFSEPNLTKLDRKQDFHVLYQVCVCVFFFSGRSENQDDNPGLWLAKKLSTSSL